MPHHDEPDEQNLSTYAWWGRGEAPDAARRATRILTTTLRHRELEAPDEALQNYAADLAAHFGARGTVRAVRTGATADEASLTLRVVVRGELVAHLDLARDVPFDPFERELAGYGVRFMGDRLTQLSLQLEMRGLADITAAIASATDVATGARAFLDAVTAYTGAGGTILLRRSPGGFEVLGRAGRWPDDDAESRHALARACLGSDAPAVREGDVVAYRMGREAPHRYVLLLRSVSSRPLGGTRLPGVVAAAETLSPLLESLWRDQVHAELLRFHGGRGEEEATDDLYERLLDTAIHLVHGADSGSLLIRHDRHEPFVYQAVRGFGDQTLSGVALTATEARVWYGDAKGWKAGAPRIVRADRVDVSARSGVSGPHLARHGSHTERILSNLCLPVTYGGDVMALLNLDSQTDVDAFGQDSSAIADLFAAPLADLLHRQDTEHRLRETAATDPLTGLSNRRPFASALERELARHARTGAPVSVLVMDLSGFKGINDELGHAAGDEALVRVARALRSHLREGDAIARWGGDEFAALLVGATAPEAAEVADRMVAAVAGIDVHGRALAINVGSASAPADGADDETLLKCADERMYADKRRRLGDR